MWVGSWELPAGWVGSDISVRLYVVDWADRVPLLRCVMVRANCADLGRTPALTHGVGSAGAHLLELMCVAQWCT